MENERNSVTDRGPIMGSAVWEIAGVLISWRRFILFNLLAALALSVTVGLILPRWYKATASILAPNEPNMLNGLGSRAGILREFAAARLLSGSGGNSKSYNYLAILNSRASMEAIVRKFDLISTYGAGDTSMESAIQTLSENVSFEIQNEGNILIEVYDKDPDRASAMANAFVDRLNDASVQLGSREGRNNREFVEQRLERARSELRALEDSLQSYQERSGMIIARGKRGSTIAPMAALYGLKARKEVESAILRRTSSEDSPALKQVVMELSEIDRKIATFPGIGSQSLRLYRAVRIQQRIIESLLPIYEQAKITEQNNVPVVLSLDRAVPPERTTRPHRVLIVFFASTLTLELLIVLTFVMHGIIRRTAAAPLDERVRTWVLRIAHRYRIDFGK